MKGSVINGIKAASYNSYKSTHAKFRNMLLPLSLVVGDAQTFACYRGSHYFFRVGGSKFEIRYSFGCRGFVNYLYGYANFSRYFLGYAVFHRYFFFFFFFFFFLRGEVEGVTV